MNIFGIAAELKDKLLRSSSQAQIIAATENNEKYITHKMIDVVWKAEIFCSILRVEWKEN